MADIVADRRAILGAGIMAAGIGAMALPGSARAATAGDAVWVPMHEEQDAWLAKPGTRHRLVLDTFAISAADSAIGYADTFYWANKTGYGLAPETLGVVIVLRHFATPVGYNDAIWAKYGAVIVGKLKMVGAQAVQATHGNPWLTAPVAKPKDDADPSLTSLARQGARFAICGAATTRMAKMVAKETGGDSARIEAEFKVNLIPGAVLTAAGIVAVNRAQEHGYSFVSVTE